MKTAATQTSRTKQKNKRTPPPDGKLMGGRQNLLQQIKPSQSSDDISTGRTTVKKGIVMAKRTKKVNRRTAAFTLIEIIITVAILAIVALIAVPMMSGAADMQVRSAANRLAADLEYAKNMAITHQRPFTVVFDDSTNTNGYKILNSTEDPIKNPISGRDFEVRFSNDRSLKRVQISNLDLQPGNSPDSVTFNYMGTPLIDSAELNKGEITLTADGFSLIVKIEPLTGYVTIESPTP
ncbi:MAG TPA: prepilin-type N-terminal cleavage/methylation domain-containing protein [Phycisphaerales bacterium]|nr:prepilin-type N-terminal cleavage/methylation domain-containing protein [Phycisphaerales bacterium]